MIPLILTFVFGLGLRLVLLNQSFWLDEAASIEIASRSFQQFFSQLRFDFHPPLFYLLLKLWLPFAGRSEWLIRMPFVILSSLSIIAIYFLAKHFTRTKDSRIPLVAAIFLAVNPLHIYYSQELRMYGINTLFTIISWIFLLRSLHLANRKDSYLFVIFSVLNIYSFYGAFLNLAAQAFFVMVTCTKKSHFIFLFSVIGIFFLPMLPTLLLQLQTGGYLKSSLPGWQALSGRLTPKDLLLIPAKFILGRINFVPKTLYYAIGGGFTVVYFALVALTLKTKKFLALHLYLSVPFVLACIISLWSPMMGYWRFVYFLPAFLILLVLGIVKLPRVLSLLMTGIVVVSSLMFLAYFWYMPSFQREDWRGLAASLHPEKSLIILHFPFVFAPLKYYFPQGEYYFTQLTLGQVRSDLEVSLKEKVTGYDYIYHLDYLSSLTDPDGKVLETINNIGLKPSDSRSFNGVGVATVFVIPKSVLK